MALPTMATTNTAVDNVFAALAASKAYNANSRAAIQSLQEVVAGLTKAYKPQVDFVVTDLADATLVAFFASTGELGIAAAAQNRPLEVGFVFQVGGVGDTTDNALAAAKGSAVADGDIFEVTNTGTPAVAYLGAAGTLDFTAEVFTQ